MTCTTHENATPIGSHDFADVVAVSQQTPTDDYNGAQLLQPNGANGTNGNGEIPLW